MRAFSERLSLDRLAALYETLRSFLEIKTTNFTRGIRTKENFKEYIRTRGSSDEDSTAWSNEGRQAEHTRLAI